MGLASNVIVLMIIMSYAFYAGTPNHESSIFFSLVNLQGNTTIYYPNGTAVTTESRTSGILVNIGLLIGAVTIAGIVTAILFGSEPTYALWGGFVLFMIGFFLLPIDLFMSATLPTEVKLLLGAIYGLMIMLAAIDFYRGTAPLG